MDNHKFILQGACWCGLGMALGAFGAHGLKQVATPTGLQTFETAVRYLVYHGFAILICGILAAQQPHRFIRQAAKLFTAGIFLFSGSLVLMVTLEWQGITGWQKLGAITPLGGLAFILGWIQLARAHWSPQKSG
ncbi:MAG: DUF423 domain-containing protein [Sphingobacteriia bacterium]|nr:MAG: DUF423 domain-containing protein [Sphingobacteriia bacterium]